MARRTTSIPKDLDQSQVTTWLGAGAIVGWLALWPLLGEPTACDRLPYLAGFAGDDDRFQRGLEQFGCQGLSTSQATGSIAYLFGVTVLLGLLLWNLLCHLWPRGWRSAPFRHWEKMHFIPVAGTAVLAVGELAALISIAINGEPVQLHNWLARLLPVLAWTGSIMLLVALLLTAAAALGTIGSSHTIYPQELDIVERADWGKLPVDGLGVCVSGGGIRAASVALGALSKLEQTAAEPSLDWLPADLNARIELEKARVLRPEATADQAQEVVHTVESEWCEDRPSVLDRARYLASVSGGGYVAGAYRIARGCEASAKPDSELWRGGGIFGPDDDDAGTTRASFDDDSEIDLPYDLRRHVLSRRHFLLTGRGGVIGSLALILWGLVMQAGLIAMVVFLGAWPLGRLAASWAVTDDRDLENFQIASRHWLPSVALLVVAGVLDCLRLEHLVSPPSPAGDRRPRGGRRLASRAAARRPHRRRRLPHRAAGCDVRGHQRRPDRYVRRACQPNRRSAAWLRPYPTRRGPVGARGRAPDPHRRQRVG